MRFDRSGSVVPYLARGQARSVEVDHCLDIPGVIGDMHGGGGQSRGRHGRAYWAPSVSVGPSVATTAKRRYPRRPSRAPKAVPPVIGSSSRPTEGRLLPTPLTPRRSGCSAWLPRLASTDARSPGILLTEHAGGLPIGEVRRCPIPVSERGQRHDIKNAERGRPEHRLEWW